jgi:hypothetical protein
MQVAALGAAIMPVCTAHAGLDNELCPADGQDQTLTIQQWDTFLNGVFPLDRNPLTREWFHSARHHLRRTLEHELAGGGGRSGRIVSR